MTTDRLKGTIANSLLQHDPALYNEIYPPNGSPSEVNQSFNSDTTQFLPTDTHNT